MNINLVRYSGVFLTTTFAMIALSVLLGAVGGYNMPPGLITIVAAVASAQSEGRGHVRENGTALEGMTAWIAALAMTGVALMFSLLLLLVQLALPGVIPKLTGLPGETLIGIYGLIVLIVLLVNRLFYSIGMSTEEKRQKASANP